jgi:hypothetical protein
VAAHGIRRSLHAILAARGNNQRNACRVVKRPARARDGKRVSSQRGLTRSTNRHRGGRSRCRVRSERCRGMRWHASGTQSDPVRKPSRSRHIDRIARSRTSRNTSRCRRG